MCLYEGDWGVEESLLEVLEVRMKYTRVRGIIKLHYPLHMDWLSDIVPPAIADIVG